MGGSLKSLARSGQDRRFIEGELSYYLKKFDKIYVFDYSNVKYNTNNSRIIQIRNESNIHRYIYSFVLPLKQRQIIKSCSVIRVSHLTGMIAGFVAKIYFCKKVIFNYAYDYSRFAWSEKKYLRSIFLKFFAGLSFKFADGIICASRIYSYKLIRKYGRKVNYISNGVDTRQFAPNDIAHKDKTGNILFVGRLTQQKNILNLIEAIRLLNKQNVKLTIIGDGELKGEVKAKCEKYKITYELIPKIENKELTKYYNLCDIFALPSLREGSPKVLLEAMSSGAVCLVSDIPENREVIKDEINGFVCGQSAKEIADKIKYIMQIKDTSKIKKNARETIEKQYCMDIVMKKEVDFVYGF